MAACLVVLEYVVENTPGYGVRRVLRSERMAHDARHKQAHSQQRTLTQYDMLPQHPVNIKELFCECS